MNLDLLPLPTIALVAALVVFAGARALSAQTHADGLFRLGPEVDPARDLVTALGGAIRHYDGSGAVVEDAATGQLLYYGIYPESTITTARVPVTRRADRTYLAGGFAQFYTPDRRSLIYGTYVKGRREGRWITITAGGPLTDEFAWYDEPTSIADIEAELAQLSTGRTTGPAITVQRATYRKGRVKGKVEDSRIEGEVYVPSDAPARRLPSGELFEQMPRFNDPSCEELASAGASNQEIKNCAEKAMLEYIYTNVQYPASARAAGYTGKSIVSFIVETDGRLTDIATVRFTTATIDAEARRVVASMPPWVPGYQYGKPVRVSFVLPINFDLE